MRRARTQRYVLRAFSKADTESTLIEEVELKIHLVLIPGKVRNATHLQTAIQKRFCVCYSCRLGDLCKFVVKKSRQGLRDINGKTLSARLEGRRFPLRY